MASVSFEYFPPRNQEGQDIPAETVGMLTAFQPEFQSVTYGAGGSSREGTLETVTRIAEKSGKPAASHLTYTGSTAAEVSEFARRLWDKGIHKLVALRGDSRGDSLNLLQGWSFTGGDNLLHF